LLSPPLAVFAEPRHAEVEASEQMNELTRPFSKYELDKAMKEELEGENDEVNEDETSKEMLFVRPSRPSGARPFTKYEVEEAVKELERYRKSMEKNLRAKANHEREEERKRKMIEDALKREAELKEEARKKELLRLEAEKSERIAQMKLGKVKAKVLEDPPIPKDPPKWVPLNPSSILVPRGRLTIKIDRVFGCGLVTGQGQTGTGGSAGTMAGSTVGGWLTGQTRTHSVEGIERLEPGKKLFLGSVFIRFELHLGGGTIMKARTPTYKGLYIPHFLPEGWEVEFRMCKGVIQPRADDSIPLRTRTLSPPVLFYSVWQTDRRGGREDLQLSDGQIPAGELFQPLALESSHTLPMGPVGAEGTSFYRYSDGTLKSWMSVSTRFHASTAGILAVSVHEGVKLTQVGTGKMDCFPSISLGVGENAKPDDISISGRVPVNEVTARGTPCAEGGEYPMFNHEELLLWVDHEHCVSACSFHLSLTALVQGLQMNVGSVEKSVADWTEDSAAHEDSLELKSSSGYSAGKILFTRQFFPAGILTVRVVRGHNISASDVGGGTDAYVSLTLSGRLMSYKVKTAILMGSGSEPYWNETFVFDVVDHMDMHVALWDFDSFTEDDLVGEVMVDLGGVYQHGVRDSALPLKVPNAWGVLQGSGMLLVEADFVGPPDVAYPQLQSSRPAYTDVNRANRWIEGAASAARERKEKELEKMMNEEMRKAEEFALAAKKASGAKEKEWDDGDMEEAFLYLDFNKDLYLSKEEITHALTCMGELITSLEVSEMVEMVDVDGDGRVAFFEFYQMCKEKDIANPLWRPKSERLYRTRDFLLEGGIKGIEKVGTTDTVSRHEAHAARADELKKKEEKKKACEKAIIGLAFRFQELQTAYKRFQRHSKYGVVTDFTVGDMSHEELLEVLPEKHESGKPEVVEAVRAIYFAFRRDTDDMVNIIDILLGLAGFAGCTRPQRINFCFQIYDKDGSGTLDLNELVQILKGSHLAGSTSYLKHKAVSIMKSVGAIKEPAAGKVKDAAAGGAATTVKVLGLEEEEDKNLPTIDLEMFSIAANRFPAIIFPTYEARDASGKMIRPVIDSKEMKKQTQLLEETKKIVENLQDLRTLGERFPFKFPGEQAKLEEGVGSSLALATVPATSRSEKAKRQMKSPTLAITDTATPSKSSGLNTTTTHETRSGTAAPTSLTNSTHTDAERRLTSSTNTRTNTNTNTQP